MLKQFIAGFNSSLDFDYYSTTNLPIFPFVPARKTVLLPGVVLQTLNPSRVTLFHSRRGLVV
jgi:hypothetical protein